MQIQFLIFELVVLIFSVMIHEIAHGFVAERLGDPTARRAGRLTLNPVSHIDPFGSIILPLLLAIPALFGQPAIIFGWAKPVPYNPDNLKNPKRGSGIIAIAGPLSNLAVAAVFGAFLRFLPLASYPALIPLFALIVYINILLAIFNLVPIPPLDGSKVLFAILPASRGTMEFQNWLERYGMMLVLLFIFFGFELILPIVHWLFSAITGGSLGL